MDSFKQKREDELKRQLAQCITNPAWLNLISEVRRLGFGEVIIKIQNGEPIMIEIERQKIKLK